MVMMDGPPARVSSPHLPALRHWIVLVQYQYAASPVLSVPLDYIHFNSVLLVQ